MSNFILWLSEVNDSNKSITGNKFFFLSRLYQDKLPVPPAFCITKEAFSYFLEMTGLKGRIEGILARKEIENKSDLSYAIQELIVETEIPLDLKKEIEEAYENINVDPAVQNTGSAFSLIKAGRDSTCVVVRAYGNFENVAKNTLLNVKGGKNLFYSLKKVWALHYTPENFENLDNLNLYTLVQKMINPSVSGSFHFENNDLMIKAVYGFFDNDNRDKADVYTLDRSSLFIKDKVLNFQGSKLVKDDMVGSIVMRQVASPGTKLSDNDLGFIAQVAKKLESGYSDKEITFAVEGSRLYFLNVKDKLKEKLPAEITPLIPDSFFDSGPLVLPEEVKQEIRPLSEAEMVLIEAKSGEVHIKMPKNKRSLHIAQKLLDTLSLQIED
ncbi:hypothetical protein HY500_04460 [Candidatus Woesearchaeota archaeon]|nr:hypothetical protein [Candidatus Woesearchaeota archaeon]